MAAGGVIAAGGALVIILGLVGVELLNILLVLGLTRVGLTTIGIVPRLFDAAPWLRDGWAFGLFLVAYGAYVAVQRRRHPEVAAR